MCLIIFWGQSLLYIFYRKKYKKNKKIILFAKPITINLVWGYLTNATSFFYAKKSKFYPHSFVDFFFSVQKYVATFFLFFFRKFSLADRNFVWRAEILGLECEKSIIIYGAPVLNIGRSRIKYMALPY